MKPKNKQCRIFALCLVVAVSLACLAGGFTGHSREAPADTEFLKQRVRDVLEDLKLKEGTSCVIIQTHAVDQYVLIEATCWESVREYAFKAVGKDVKASSKKFAEFARDRFTVGELMDDIDAPLVKAWLLVAKRKLHDSDFNHLT